MKKVVRRNVWETNSSTSHSVVIMTASQHDKWEEENLYYYPPTRFTWYDPFDTLSEDKKPQGGSLYTRDEVMEFYRLQGYEYDPEAGDYDTDEENKDQYIREMGDFYGYDSWHDDEYLETDTHSYTTPGGEEIIVECKYGYDG